MAELMRNKEGLTVTDQLDFGDVLIGESKSLMVWIRYGVSNKLIASMFAFCLGTEFLGI